jgi:hypothetical protein
MAGLLVTINPGAGSHHGAEDEPRQTAKHLARQDWRHLLL